MATASKEALLGRRAETESGFPEEDVEIPGLGTVRVRGLSRHEAIHIQAANGKGTAVLERLIVSLGLVDPVMSEDDVKQWQKVSVGMELDPVTRAIFRLSGLAPDAAKQAYKDFEADPGSEFRLLPGEGASDDGGAAAPGDEQ